MIRELRKLNKNIIMITLDIGDCSYIRKIQLPGEIILAIWGEQKNYVDKESINTDEIGRQNVYVISSD